MPYSFGENLKRLMQDKDVSARKLAKDINVPYKTVQEWLTTSARMPRDPEALRRISEYFKCSIHQILFGEPEPESILGQLLEKTEIHTGLYEITIKKVKERKK